MLSGVGNRAGKVNTRVGALFEASFSDNDEVGCRMRKVFESGDKGLDTFPFPTASYEENDESVIRNAELLAYFFASFFTFGFVPEFWSEAVVDGGDSFRRGN